MSQQPATPAQPPQALPAGRRRNNNFFHELLEPTDRRYRTLEETAPMGMTLPQFLSSEISSLRCTRRLKSASRKALMYPTIADKISTARQRRSPHTLPFCVLLASYLIGAPLLAFMVLIGLWLLWLPLGALFALLCGLFKSTLLVVFLCGLSLVMLGRFVARMMIFPPTVAAFANQMHKEIAGRYRARYELALERVQTSMVKALVVVDEMDSSFKQQPHHPALIDRHALRTLKEIAASWTRWQENAEADAKHASSRESSGGGASTTIIDDGTYPRHVSIMRHYLQTLISVLEAATEVRMGKPVRLNGFPTSSSSQQSQVAAAAISLLASQSSGNLVYQNSPPYISLTTSNASIESMLLSIVVAPPPGQDSPATQTTTTTTTTSSPSIKVQYTLLLQVGFVAMLQIRSLLPWCEVVPYLGPGASGNLREIAQILRKNKSTSPTIQLGNGKHKAIDGVITGIERRRWFQIALKRHSIERRHYWQTWFVHTPLVKAILGLLRCSSTTSTVQQQQQQQQQPPSMNETSFSGASPNKMFSIDQAAAAIGLPAECVSKAQQCISTIEKIRFNQSGNTSTSTTTSTGTVSTTSAPAGSTLHHECESAECNCGTQLLELSGGNNNDTETTGDEEEMTNEDEEIEAGLFNDDEERGSNSGSTRSSAANAVNARISSALRFLQHSTLFGRIMAGLGRLRRRLWSAMTAKYVPFPLFGPDYARAETMVVGKGISTWVQADDGMWIDVLYIPAKKQPKNQKQTVLNKNGSGSGSNGSSSSTDTTTSSSIRVHIPPFAATPTTASSQSEEMYQDIKENTHHGDQRNTDDDNGNVPSTRRSSSGRRLESRRRLVAFATGLQNAGVPGWVADCCTGDGGDENAHAYNSDDEEEIEKGDDDADTVDDNAAATASSTRIRINNTRGSNIPSSFNSTLRMFSSQWSRYRWREFMYNLYMNAALNSVRFVNYSLHILKQLVVTIAVRLGFSLSSLPSFLLSSANTFNVPSSSSSSTMIPSPGPRVAIQATSSAVAMYCSPNAGLTEYAFRGNGWVDYYLSKGMDVCVWSYRGYGRSGIISNSSSSTSGINNPRINNSAVPRPALLRADAQAVALWLRQQVGAQKLVVHGESLGGIAACAVAAKGLATVLITDRTFDTLPRTAKKMVGGWSEGALGLITGWTRSNADAFDSIPGHYEENAKMMNNNTGSNSNNAKNESIRCACITAADTADDVIHWSASLAAEVCKRQAMRKMQALYKKARLGINAPSTSNNSNAGAPLMTPRLISLRHELDAVASHLHFLLRHLCRLTAPLFADSESFTTSALLSSNGASSSSSSGSSGAGNGTDLRNTTSSAESEVALNIEVGFHTDDSTSSSSSPTSSNNHLARILVREKIFVHPRTLAYQEVIEHIYGNGASNGGRLIVADDAVYAAVALSATATCVHQERRISNIVAENILSKAPSATGDADGTTTSGSGSGIGTQSLGLKYDTRFFGRLLFENYSAGAILIVLAGMTNGIGARFGETGAESMSEGGGNGILSAFLNSIGGSGNTNSQGGGGDAILHGCLENIRVWICAGLVWGWDPSNASNAGIKYCDTAKVNKNKMKQTQNKPRKVAEPPADDDEEKDYDEKDENSEDGEDSDDDRNDTDNDQRQREMMRNSPSFMASRFPSIGRVPWYLRDQIGEIGPETVLRRLQQMLQTFEENASSATVSDGVSSSGAGATPESAAAASVTAAASRKFELASPSTTRALLMETISVIERLVHIRSLYHEASTLTPATPTSTPTSTSTTTSTATTSTEESILRQALFSADGLFIPLTCNHSTAWSKQELKGLDAALALVVFDSCE